jgi:hypothetical protein
VAGGLPAPTPPSSERPANSTPAGGRHARRLPKLPASPPRPSQKIISVSYSTVQHSSETLESSHQTKSLQTLSPFDLVVNQIGFKRFVCEGGLGRGRVHATSMKQQVLFEMWPQPLVGCAREGWHAPWERGAGCRPVHSMRITEGKPPATRPAQNALGDRSKGLAAWDMAAPLGN